MGMGVAASPKLNFKPSCHLMPVAMNTVMDTLRQQSQPFKPGAHLSALRRLLSFGVQNDLPPDHPYLVALQNQSKREDGGDHSPQDGGSYAQLGPGDPGQGEGGGWGAKAQYGGPTSPAVPSWLASQRQAVQKLVTLELSIAPGAEAVCVKITVPPPSLYGPDSMGLLGDPLGFDHAHPTATQPTRGKRGRPFGWRKAVHMKSPNAPPSSKRGRGRKGSRGGMSQREEPANMYPEWSYGDTGPRWDDEEPNRMDSSMPSGGGSDVEMEGEDMGSPVEVVARGSWGRDHWSKNLDLSEAHEDPLALLALLAEAAGVASGGGDASVGSQEDGGGEEPGRHMAATTRTGRKVKPTAKW
eukprot:gene8588-34030_t